jgi:predicted esterase
VSRALIAGVALTASLALSAPASAATSLHGRVVGKPSLRGASAVVPVLDVGGASAPALPLETISAVNEALHAVMDVLDETDVDVPLLDGV